MRFRGDLNTPAEHLLMRHYGNDAKVPTTLAETGAMIQRARERFAVDNEKPKYDDFPSFERLAPMLFDSIYCRR